MKTAIVFLLVGAFVTLLHIAGLLSVKAAIVVLILGVVGVDAFITFRK